MTNMEIEINKYANQFWEFKWALQAIGQDDTRVSFTRFWIYENFVIASDSHFILSFRRNESPLSLRDVQGNFITDKKEQGCFTVSKNTKTVIQLLKDESNIFAPDWQVVLPINLETHVISDAYEKRLTFTGNTVEKQSLSEEYCFMILDASEFVEKTDKLKMSMIDYTFFRKVLNKAENFDLYLTKDIEGGYLFKANNCFGFVMPRRQKR